MAAFCSKCGAPLSSSTGFCPACGTPIAAAAPVPPSAVPPTAPVPPAAAYPPQAAAPVASYPPAAAYPPAGPPKSSSALKIILIIVAVVVGLGILGAGTIGFMVWRAAKSVTVDQNGNNAKVSLPGVGTITAGDSVASDEDLGVPAYPGALREKGGMNMSTGSASMIMAHFSTSDSIAQVTDFYKGKLGENAVTASSGDGTVLSSNGSDNDKIMVTIGPGNGEDAGKTTIVVMHTKKKQS